MFGNWQLAQRGISKLSIKPPRGGSSSSIYTDDDDDNNNDDGT